MERIQTEKEWYDNPNILTSIIIAVILITIIMSQAFAVKNNIGTVNTVRSLLNHNTTYILGLVYFCFIKSNVGKKYFNFINVIYIALYLLMVLAAFLTIFQSFGIASLANLLLNFIILFYMICTLSGLVLLVNLIGAVNFDGVVLSLFDAIYTILFGRYIYLYKDYEDSKAKNKKDSKKVEK